LKDYEYAIQVGGRSQDTFLPGASDKLKIARMLTPRISPWITIKQCLECATCYSFRTTYKYLVYGSEDEQFPTRLTEEEALEYLTQPLSE
jgi:hypothetical protein